MIRSLLGEKLDVLPGHLLSARLVLLPLVSCLVIEGVVGVGLSQQALDRQQDRLHLQSRRPVCLEDIEADAAEVVCMGDALPMLGW